LALHSVELRVAEEAKLKGEVLTDEEASDDSISADCVSREVERALMRDVVVRFKFLPVLDES
jgi:hypothetical protein